jgi:hypothetical protein
MGEKLMYNIQYSILNSEINPQPPFLPTYFRKLNRSRPGKSLSYFPLFI